MQHIKGSHIDPAGSTTTRTFDDNEQQEGKNLTTWLNLVNMAVTPLSSPQETIVDAYWKKGIRPDGRKFSESRPYYIQHGALSPSMSTLYGSTSSSDVLGSAMVRTATSTLGGNTIVLASVTTQVGQPAVTAPKNGDVLVTVVSCNSIGSSNNHYLLSTQSFLQRILEESMDLEQLMIVEGKAAYRLVVTVSIIQDDSAFSSVTLTDVCLAAAVAALLDTKLPAQPIVDDGIVYAYDTMYGVETKPLFMPIVPCSVTAIGVRLHQDNDDQEKRSNALKEKHCWIVDPDLEEQRVQEAFATIVVNAKSSAEQDESDGKNRYRNEHVLSVMFAPSTMNTIQTHPLPSFTGTNGITATELSHIVYLALEHAKSLFAILLPPTQRPS